MATNPLVKSSSSSKSNHVHEYELELGVGDTNNPSPYSGSNPSMVEGVGQLGLNQRMNELRSTKNRGWVQGLSAVRNHSGEQGQGSSEILMRAKHLGAGAGAGAGAGVSSSTSTSTTNPNEVVEDTSHKPQHVHASASSPNEIIIGTVSARELLRSQVLYNDASIRERFVSNLNFNGNVYDYDDINIRSPSPGLGLSLQYRRRPHSHAVNYPIPIPTNTILIGVPNYSSSSHQNLICSPTHPSSQSYSHSHLSLTKITTHLDKTTLCRPSSLSRSTPNETISKPGCSTKKYLHNINLRQITNELNRNNHPAAPDQQVNNMQEDDSNDDGRIHSLPYKKNGPYTCPKCNQEFPTSQHFASHVGAKHYKYETKAQRRKRLMARVRRRNLHLQESKDGHITILPVSPDHPAAGNSYAYAPRFGGKAPAPAPATAPAVKVEVEEGGLQDQDPVAPPGMEAYALNAAKIKEEPYP